MEPMGLSTRATCPGNWWRDKPFSQLKATYKPYNLLRVQRAFEGVVHKEEWVKNNGDLSLRMMALLSFDPTDSIQRKIWHAVLQSGVLENQEGLTLLEEIDQAKSGANILSHLLVCGSSRYGDVLHMLLDSPKVQLKTPENPAICQKLREGILAHLKKLTPEEDLAIISTLMAKGLERSFWQNDWGFWPYQMEICPDRAQQIAECFDVEDFNRVYLDGGWPHKVDIGSEHRLQPLLSGWFENVEKHLRFLKRPLEEKLQYFSDKLQEIDTQMDGRQVWELSNAFRGERDQVRSKFSTLGWEFREMVELRSQLERRLVSLKYFGKEGEKAVELLATTQAMIDRIDRMDKEFGDFVQKYDERFNPPSYCFHTREVDKWKEFSKPPKRKRLRRAVVLESSSETESDPEFQRVKRAREGKIIIQDSHGKVVEVLPSEESSFWESVLETPNLSQNNDTSE